jgi:hypothetical protein
VRTGGQAAEDEAGADGAEEGSFEPAFHGELRSGC